MLSSASTSGGNLQDVSGGSRDPGPLERLGWVWGSGKFPGSGFGF